MNHEPTTVALPPCESPITRRWVLTWLVGSALVTALVLLIHPKPGELPVYLLGAERMARGEEIYRIEPKPFTYPPFFALPFVPLTWLPTAVIEPVWFFVNLVLLGGVLALVIRQIWPLLAVRSPAERRWFLAIVGVLSARYWISPIEYQSHDLIVFLCVMLAIDRWTANRSGWTGLWAGLATACKATPLLFLPVLVLQRRFRTAAVFVTVMVVASLLPDVVYPRGDGGSWSLAWYRTFVSKVGVGTPAEAAGAWTSWNLLNQSLSGTLYRLSHPAPPVAAQVSSISYVPLCSLSPAALKILTALLQLGIVGLVFAATWRRHRSDLPPAEQRFRHLAEGAVVVCAMVLLSPMSSKQHFCVLLLPIVVCAAEALFHRRDPLIALALLPVLFNVVAVKDLVGRPLGNLVLAYGGLTWCAVVCLLATSRILLTDSRSVANQTQRLDANEGASRRAA